ncbi:MAG: fused MFS/spermidine synthase [Candidatus Omnitrophica bacterium]|nr:fused MFS/spermidine synthase [Candidatus Omnitrophota bacterium]
MDKKDKVKKIIFLLFFFSGVSALVYEVVWLRMLSRVVGVSTYATAITLAAFMGGLALGSFIFGKIADKRTGLLRIFALLQVSIAFLAVSMPLFLKIVIPLQKYVYGISNQNIGISVLLRSCVSFFILLIPTVLMGGTLPVLTAHMLRKNTLYGETFSLLYGLNTLGAVFGVVVSGFVTIGVFGERNTVLIGVLINCFVGVISFILHKQEMAYAEAADAPEGMPKKIGLFKDAPISPYPDMVRKIILISILVSGFTSLAYEVIWSRQLILFLKTSIYAFSGMLAVYLAGLASGSMFVNRFVDRLKIPIIFFGITELFIGFISVFNLYLFRFLDQRFLTRMLSPVILVFPLTFLFGAIFPVASSCYVKSTKRAGASTGIVYGFNTIGSVLGSLITGFLLIHIIGSTRTVILLSAINVMLGSVLLWFEPKKTFSFKLCSLCIIPIIFFMSLGLKGKDPFLDTIAQKIKGSAENFGIYYNGETTEATVTSYSINNSKQLLINGVGITRLLTETKLMAHLPLMLAKNPKTILVVCFGMGTTVKSASIYEDLDITTVELVPKVYDCFEFYHEGAKEILSKGNIKLVSEDGRNFLTRSADKFDVITIDPAPPIHSAGTVNFYTREFFILCKEHLTQNGVACLWFPGGTVEERKYIFKTFYTVFPNTTIWSGPHNWGFYIIGALKPINIDTEKIKNAFENKKLLNDLREYDNSCTTLSQLLNLLIMDSAAINEYTKGSPVITDNFPYTEFPLWRYLKGRYKRI